MFEIYETTDAWTVRPIRGGARSPSLRRVSQVEGIVISVIIVGRRFTLFFSALFIFSVANVLTFSPLLCVDWHS